MRWYHKAVIGTALTWVGLVMSTGSGCGRSDDVAGTTGAGGATTTTTTGGQGGEGGNGPDVTDFEPCAEAQAAATLVPVNMFIAIDKSGSMDDNMKWVNTQAAFTAFFQDPAAAPLNVALRFWPDDGCDQMGCDIMACATPQVALDSLSDTAHQQALINLFQSKMPGGNTPVSAALDGAVLWSQNYLTGASQDEKVVIILVTDGEPNGCDENPANITAIADGAFTSSGILTYAVGLPGAGEPLMNSIAAAGGTNMGIIIGNTNAQQDLLNALLDIAGQSVQCTFAVPDPVDGELLDPRLVRVEYGAAGGNPALLDHVADASACGNGGWYYDDNANPTTITFCPETCNTVQSDTMAAIDIALGCECEIDADCPDGLICEDHHCVPPCSDATCPEGEICRDGRCVPAEGDPCEEDTQCPDVQTCNGGQCSYDGGIVVGPYEAVQGGAFSCSLPAGKRDSNGIAWLMAALGLAALARRRQHN